MANGAFLVAEPSFVDILVDDPRVQFLRYSRYCIAILWFSLFTSTDMRIRILDDLEGVTHHLPVLFTETEKARARVAARRGSFLRHFPDECSAYYDAWQTLIDGVGEQYLELEGLEIFGLSPETYQEVLLLNLRAYEEDDLDGWRNLIEQAGLDFDEEQAMAITGGLDIEEELIGYD